MLTVSKVAFALLFAGTVALLLAWPGGSDGSRSTSGASPAELPGETTPPGPDTPPADTPGAVRTVALASDRRAEEKGTKTPPAPDGRPIGMAEAVTIAEKLGKGSVMKAERRDRPEALFKFEVVGRDGQKRRIELNLDGTVRPISK